MKKPIPFNPRKRPIAAMIAFVCYYWNRPGVLYSVTFPSTPVKGQTNGNQS